VGHIWKGESLRRYGSESWQGKKASVHWGFSSAHVALAIQYNLLAGRWFLGLPTLTAVEGSELFPQVPKGEILLSQREKERESQPKRSTIPKPWYSPGGQTPSCSLPFTVMEKSVFIYLDLSYFIILFLNVLLDIELTLLLLTLSCIVWYFFQFFTLILSWFQRKSAINVNDNAFHVVNYFSHLCWLRNMGCGTLSFLIHRSN
jgi:hypothetical protein